MTLVWGPQSLEGNRLFWEESALQSWAWTLHTSFANLYISFFILFISCYHQHEYPRVGKRESGEEFCGQSSRVFKMEMRKHE